VRLLGCVGKHCTCQTLPECGPHELLRDQSTLDHLVYLRSARAHLVDAEWNVAEPPFPQALPAFTGVGRVKRGLPKRALVAVAFAALVGLMSAGGAWHSVAPTTPPIGAWQTR